MNHSARQILITDVQRSDIEAYRIAYSEAELLCTVWQAMTWGPYPTAMIGGVVVRDMTPQDLRTIQMTIPQVLAPVTLNYPTILNFVWLMSVDFVEQAHPMFNRKYKQVANTVKAHIMPKRRLMDYLSASKQHRVSRAQKRLTDMAQALNEASETIRLYVKRHFLYGTGKNDPGLSSHAIESRLMHVTAASGNNPLGLEGSILKNSIPKILESLDAGQREKRINPIEFDLITRFDDIIQLCRADAINAQELDKMSWQAVNAWRKEWGIKYE